MEKILFLTNYQSPYRISFFDELGKYVDLTVLFYERAADMTHRDAAWFISDQGNFKNVQLAGQKKLGKKTTICMDVIDWLKKDFDHIILCGYSAPTIMLAMTWLKLHRIPYWLCVDGGLIRRERKAKYLFKKLLVSSASRWLSTGDATTDFLVHYGADRSRVVEYPFASLFEADILTQPVSREEKEVLRRELGITGEKIYLSIGQFIHRKGYDVLMKAAASLEPEAQICIVGGQPTQEYLDLAESLGLKNIHFAGFMKKEQLLKYYRAADLFVLPTREDIWGLVVGEAMAMGLPVITTDRCVAGLVLVEEGQTGYIVPVEDDAALAEKMNLALHQDIPAMSRKALQRVRPYTIENMAKVHVQILTDRS